MKKMNKIITIVVISMIGISAIASEIAQANDEICLRVPIIRDAEREKKALIEVQRQEIKERLARLKVIRDEMLIDTTDDNIAYLKKTADYFGLFVEDYRYSNEAELFAGALYILSQAELDSLELPDEDFSGSFIFGGVNVENLRHELGHLGYTYEIFFWSRLLNYKGLASLKPKIALALTDKLISFLDNIIKTNKDERGHIRFAIETLDMLKEFKQDLAVSMQDKLVDVHEKLNRLFSTNGQIILQLASRQPCIYGNSAKLSYIWMNLYRNAKEAFRDAIDKGAIQRKQLNIVIKTRAISREGKNFIEIIFSDNGPGIPEEILKDRKLFAKGETSKKTGTGMGLYIAEQVVKDCGGAIEARNIPASGAEFTITLPSAEEIQNLQRVLSSSPHQTLAGQFQHIAKSTGL